MKLLPPRNLDQEFKIKRLLAERGETMSSLARALDAPAGSVANNVYGYRQDPDLQARIAAWLGQPVARLFGPNGETPAAGESPC